MSVGLDAKAAPLYSQSREARYRRTRDTGSPTLTKPRGFFFQRIHPSRPEVWNWGDVDALALLRVPPSNSASFLPPCWSQDDSITLINEQWLSCVWRGDGPSPLGLSTSLESLLPWLALASLAPVKFLFLIHFASGMWVVWVCYHSEPSD